MDEQEESGILQTLHAYLWDALKQRKGSQAYKGTGNSVMRGADLTFQLFPDPCVFQQPGQ